MTARKPKPKPRKASGPTLEQRVAELEEITHFHNGAIVGLQACVSVDRKLEIAECMRRLDALESRDRLRDKSHDEPVSNAGEAIGQHFRIVGERRRWWRFWRLG